ncbi:MAG: HU family DNA-binding protein [Candidatus Nanopelagicales bacterium]
MNKQDLIEAVSTQLGHSKRDVTDVVVATLNELKRAVSGGAMVALRGFGVFERAQRNARMGRNPQTGEAVKISATKLPKFRAGAEFKAVVSGAKKMAAPAKKAAAKPAAKKAAAKPAAKRAPAKKAAAKKAPAKKAPAKKAAARK